MTDILPVAEVLERAADLIEPEGAWTQGAYNRDPAGRPYVEEPKAVCWCVEGAVIHCVGDMVDGMEIVRSFAELALIPLIDEGTKYESRHVPTWNDAPERTQAEVVAKLREAAALARNQS